MAVKELIEARWKMFIGSGVVVVLAAVFAATYDLLKQLLQNAMSTSSQQLPQALQDQVQQMLGSYDVYLWTQWFSKTGPEALALLAAILGAGLISNEVSKGTIFFVLSRPISRDRVLLVKYGINAAILLGVIVLGSIALLVASTVVGHPQNVEGILVSTALLWLGMLFIQGLAVLGSVFFKDVLRPLIGALLITILLSIPGYIPGWSAWNLTGYWGSLPAYLGQEFPTKALLICLVAALLPLLAAIPLFRRQAY